jgi:hypothetical protein
MATCDDCVLCPNLSQAKAAVGIMPSENAEAEDSQRLELDRLGPVLQRQPAEFGQVLGSRYHFEEVRFANDSPVEGDGFEPSVPQQIRSDLGTAGPSPITVDSLATGTGSSNPFPSSREAVSLPHLLSKRREPRLSASVCAAGLVTGTAETRRVFRYRANPR